MKQFLDESRLMAELGADTLYFVKAMFLQEKWRWLPSALGAVLLDAATVFTQLFWIVILLWFSDLVIGIAKAWHSPDEELEWGKVFKSVIKLFVITISAVAMNAIEQMLSQMGLNINGKLVVATLLVIGSADAFSLLSNLAYFYPAMTTVADRVKGFLGQVAEVEQRRSGDSEGGGG